MFGDVGKTRNLSAGVLVDASRRRSVLYVVNGWRQVLSSLRHVDIIAVCVLLPPDIFQLAQRQIFEHTGDFVPGLGSTTFCGSICVPNT